MFNKIGSTVLWVNRYDLKTTHAALASEWDDVKNENLTPEMVSAGIAKKVFWLCSAHGHSYESRLNDRSNGCGCPYCAGKKFYVVSMITIRFGWMEHV